LIAPLAAVGLAWFALAVFPVFAAVHPGLAAADPARAAREVFKDQRFWWKRIESPSVSTPWFDAILGAVRDFFGRILRAIGDLLARILRALSGIFTGPPSGAAVAVRLIVAGLLAWSIWKLLALLVRWLRSSVPRPDAQEDVTLRMLEEPSDLFEQAGQRLSAGLYAEAIRFALLALIARLEKLGLLRFDPTRTNREYQRELHERSELATRFGELARIYERVWYGRVPAGRVEAEAAINLCGSLINREDLAPG
jgi:hypothetical protein